VPAERRGVARGSDGAPGARPLHVYDRLKDAIITGTLRPLERITENKVAADFGLSRTPVRQALQRLEAEGLIQVVPKRGSFVSRPTIEDILEIYQIRTPLEAACARVAAERIEDDQLALLDRLVRVEQGRGPGRSPDRSLRAAAQFHAVIYGCSRNQRMATLLVDLQNQVHRVRVLWPSTVARLNDTWVEHAGIVDALRSRDGAGAERLMIEHLTKARLSTLNRILPSTGI
jgi:DNA-binding GntR family transcriptional regulator